MNVLDLFSGIGGFSLGLERAGMKTVGFCEIEWNAVQVLQRHWPTVPVYKDVRTLTGLTDIDIITGGFPCTDLSQSSNGSHEGIYGEQSGLVFEFGRIVKELQPKWIVIENVPQIKKYKVQVQEIFNDYILAYNDTDAAEYGADCRRKRTFIIGHHRARGGREVFIKPTVDRTAGSVGVRVDKLPMLLPWKGGVSLERLASCIVSSAETNTIRVRKGVGISRRLGDGHLYLMLGNSLSPLITYEIGKAIVNAEGSL